jgi:hypothetical protein
MNVYAYCLSDEIAADSLEALKGIGGATTRLLWRGGVAAVVSDFAGDAVAVTRANVLAHERVVGGVLARTTPLPFRFGTLVGEERLMSYVASQGEALRAQLERVRGCVEMSVKVIWKAEASENDSSSEQSRGSSESCATDDQSSRDQSSPDQSSLDRSRLDQPSLDRSSLDQASPGAGTAFLLAKRREIVGEEMKAARAKEIADWLACVLAGAVRDSVVEVNPHGALVVSAAHLVERARLADYQERLRGAQAARRDLYFLTSGVWSPYSFTSARA